MLVNIIFPNIIRIIIYEIINEKPKYPEVGLFINTHQIPVQDEEIIKLKKIIITMKPTVTNMKTKIRNLLVNINGPPSSTILAKKSQPSRATPLEIMISAWPKISC